MRVPQRIKKLDHRNKSCIVHVQGCPRPQGEKPSRVGWRRLGTKQCISDAEASETDDSGPGDLEHKADQTTIGPCPAAPLRLPLQGRSDHRKGCLTSWTPFAITSRSDHRGGLMTPCSPLAFCHSFSISGVTPSGRCSAPPAIPVENLSWRTSPISSHAASRRSMSSLLCAAETQKRIREEIRGVAG
jgi:hypothetical protein